jgi:membrane protease YdiL (CAAX protease family)
MNTERVRGARRGLRAYLLLVVALSTIADGALIVTQQSAWLIILMLIPGGVSLAVRLARNEGFGDISFEWGGPHTGRAMVKAVVLPIGVGAIAYGLAFMLGVAEFQVPDTLPGGSVLGRFFVLLFIAGGGNSLIGLLGAAGEEIGWRGYMLPRLLDGRIPLPVFLSGLIWGMWHLPLILSGLYASGSNVIVSCAVFLVGAVAFGFILAGVRLATGSIWPAVVMHAVWNGVTQSVFDRVATGPQAQLWIGESGLLVAATMVVVALISTRKGASASESAPTAVRAQANVA